MSFASTIAETLRSALSAVERLFTEHVAGAPCVECMAGKSAAPGLDPKAADSAISDALKEQRTLLERRKAELDRWNDDDRKRFVKWFGSTDDAARDTMKARVDKMLDLNSKYSTKNFHAGNVDDVGADSWNKTFAYVYPDDDSKVYLGPQFAKSGTSGFDSRAGTLSHEMSHFKSVGGTEDFDSSLYGVGPSLELARTDPTMALQHADSFEYYLEDPD